MLLKEIEALRLHAADAGARAAIARLEARADELRAEIYAHLTPWQRVQVARHPNRPDTLDYVERLFTDFAELHGDRRFADDHAIVTGLALLTRTSRSRSSATRRAATPSRRSTATSATRKPEGYRKALRVMQLAEKFKRPIIVFIDTPAAYPGIESEERGVAEAIALNLREMALLDVPIVVIVCGEGGSGGALGHRDRRSRADAGVQRLQRHPAGGLRGDSLARREAQGRGRRGAEDHGAGPARARAHRRDRQGAAGRRAHATTTQAAALVDEALARHLAELEAMRCRRRGSTRATRSSARWAALGQAFVDDGARPTAAVRERRAEPSLMHRRVWEDVPADEATRRALAAGARRAPGHRAAAVPARAGRPGRRATRSSTRRSTSCTIRFCWPACARPSIGCSARSRAASAIAIHGDYDVDGITSTVILRRALEMLGGDVVHFVPDRLRDGYGLQPATIERLHAAGARLIVSVDCGIRAAEAARPRARARRRSHHHRPSRARRGAAAGAGRHQPKRARLRVSRQAPGRRRRRAEARAGAARGERPAAELLPHFVKIAAIGTLADVVPLVGENRVIARLGLASLSRGPHGAGLEALLEASGLLGQDARQLSCRASCSRRA